MFENPVQDQNPYGSLLPMEEHTHTCIIPHINVLAWGRFPHARTQIHMNTEKHKAMHEPSMRVTHTRTHTFAHTLTEGVRVICGPSHASPTQRCPLAGGVIIGHESLFLCQTRPCQEMTDNRAQH